LLDYGPLAGFIIASLIIVVSPGADSFLLLRSTVNGGLRAGLRTLGGIVTGNVSWAILTISGIGLLVSQVAVAMLVLKILGGLYLVYLAAMSLRSGLRQAQTAGTTGASEVSTDAGESQVASPKATRFGPYLVGLFTNLTNPKPLLFFLAFFPQFLGHASNIGLQLTMLSLIFLVMAIIWQIALVLGANSLSSKINSPNFNKVMDLICAVAFAAIAVFIFSEL
jgi:threonine/homoserine/homoserine lactone efflux protein